MNRSDEKNKINLDGIVLEPALIFHPALKIPGKGCTLSTFSYLFI